MLLILLVKAQFSAHKLGYGHDDVSEIGDVLVVTGVLERVVGILASARDYGRLGLVVAHYRHYVVEFAIEAAVIVVEDFDTIQTAVVSKSPVQHPAAVVSILIWVERAAFFG